eukprot:scaffold122010_cov57-Phaeocystis_antarctica.AAC.2
MRGSRLSSPDPPQWGQHSAERADGPRAIEPAPLGEAMARRHRATNPSVRRRALWGCTPWLP